MVVVVPCGAVPYRTRLMRCACLLPSVTAATCCLAQPPALLSRCTTGVDVFPLRVACSRSRGAMWDHAVPHQDDALCVP